ncbi:MAG: ABC transporter permease [Bryobacteraceae bacterium]
MNIWNDLRYALRTFRKAPLFTGVAVLSLGLGIGANTAIFSLLDQILLRLLPVKNPQELVLLTMRGPHYGSNWGGNAISYPMYKDFKDNNQVFTDMFCRFPFPASLGYGGKTDRVNVELVSGSYFPVLGIGATIGRTISPDDDRTPGGHPLVVLSYDFWQSRFVGDKAIIGKTLVIDGRNMTVIGIALPGFNGVELGQAAQMFVPMMMAKELTPLTDALKNRRQRWVNAFGRLKPGVTAAQAKASLQPFMHSMLEMEVKEPAFRNASEHTRQQFLKCWMNVLPGSQGRSYLREQLTTSLWVLMAITGAVLLMACSNIANLLLARASARQKEVAIRVAIGASRGRIVSQLLVESLLLSFLGAAVGLAFAYAADSLLLNAYLPADSNQLNISTAPDFRVLAFTFCVTLFTALLFGLVPALQASRPDVAPTLKDQAGSVVGGGHVTLRKTLVAVQVTLSLLLLICAGLFLRTLTNLRSLGPGFSPERLIGFNLDPSLNGYKPERVKLFYQQLTDSLAATPGVHSVGLASMRILEDDEWDSSVTVEGYNAAQGEGPEPFMNSIGPNYFATLGVPILQGRDFTTKDTLNLKHGDDPDDFVPATIIINEKFAKKYFAGRNPIGLHIGFGSDPGTKTDMAVIGVVKDIKYTNLRDEIPVQAYIPYLAGRRAGGMTVYARTTLEPRQMYNVMREKVRGLDPNVPVYAMRTTEEQINNSLRTERLVSSLSTVFGSLATLLAVIGLYGVMAYNVTRRTREIGIRIALGAIGGKVIWMVMREVLILIGIGVVVGLPAAIGLSSLIKSQLYGLAPTDPLTLALATLLLAAVAGLAGFIPAFRASRVDPVRALRYE